VRQDLRGGDVVHIPAATPRQLLLAGDKTIACLILEVKETA
jgi:quercetin dioxygenase-like cupin family protein